MTAKRGSESRIDNPPGVHIRLIRQQDCAIVRGAVQDMDDDHLRVLDAVEDQVVAMNASSDTMVLVAGNEGETVGAVDEVFALAAELPDE